MTKTKTRRPKRNPTDATLRNVRATQRRFEAITMHLTRIETRIQALQEDVETLLHQTAPLPPPPSES